MISHEELAAIWSAVDNGQYLLSEAFWHKWSMTVDMSFKKCAGLIHSARGSALNEESRMALNSCLEDIKREVQDITKEVHSDPKRLLHHHIFNVLQKAVFLTDVWNEDNDAGEDLARCVTEANGYIERMRRGTLARGGGIG